MSAERPPARRFNIRELLSRIEQEWSGSDLELEIRAGLPGRFLKKARKGGMRRPETKSYWLGLEQFLNDIASLAPGMIRMAAA